MVCFYHFFLFLSLQIKSFFFLNKTKTNQIKTHRERKQKEIKNPIMERKMFKHYQQQILHKTITITIKLVLKNLNRLY